MSHKLVSLYIGKGEYYTRIDADNVIAELKAQKAQAEDDCALLRRNNAELREATRWRKCSEELPSEEGYYLICGSSGFRTADKWTYCKDRQKMDFSFYSYGVKYWMPLPSAPKEGE